MVYVLTTIDHQFISDFAIVRLTREESQLVSTIDGLGSMVILRKSVLIHLKNNSTYQRDL